MSHYKIRDEIIEREMKGDMLSVHLLWVRLLAGAWYVHTSWE